MRSLDSAGGAEATRSPAEAVGGIQEGVARSHPAGIAGSPQLLLTCWIWCPCMPVRSAVIITSRLSLVWGLARHGVTSRRCAEHVHVKSCLNSMPQWAGLAG